MKKGQSKSKGNSFEIRICRRLTKWVTGKERPEIFWRTASSGAKATMSKRVGHATKMHGDIMAIDPKGAFLTDNILIECKHYRDFRFEHLIVKSGLVYKWWSKCCVEAEQANKQPLLIFRHNNGNNYVMVGSHLLGAIEEWYGKCSRACYLSVCFGEDSVPLPNPSNGRIMLLEDFLEWIETESLKCVCE